MSANPRHELLLSMRWPQPLGQHPSCMHCQAPLSEEDIIDLQFRGLVQVIAGKDAIEIADVTYQCACGSRHVVRFQKP